jgi:ABC-2 type transport system ATP-binding protein
MCATSCLPMLEGMIRVEQLTRTYGSYTAVDDISFIARPGRVTGFLGPNGAGKTTAMRMMVGLTTPNHGEATIGGYQYHDIVNPGRHVGVLLDASAQHAGRTGREILTIGAKTMSLPATRVDEMLAAVSLTESESKRKLRNYSLGMKQRLGIAHALLGDPAVLILDEPANGLDPAGIRWMRDLLKGYARRGGTVLLSSHLLNEVELVADELILIGRGKIVAQGDMKTLSSRDAADSALVTAVDNQALVDALAQEGHRAMPEGDGFRVEASTTDVSRVSVEHHVLLTDLRSGAKGLEDLFLELTSPTQREGAPAPGSTSPVSPAPVSPTAVSTTKEFAR